MSWNQEEREVYYMKNKTSIFIAILAAAMIFAGCGSPEGKDSGNKTASEENAGALISQNSGADSTESTTEKKRENITENKTENKTENGTENTQTFAEETESLSEYFTNEQLDHIRQSLGIPDDLPVEIEVGTPYYWEGGDMDLIQVDFYHEGEYVAGAAFKPYTEEMVRNMYQYSE